MSLFLPTNAMPKRLVNLDALIPREDFEKQDDPGQPSTNLAIQVKAADLEATNLTYQALRKPDFQRETASWEPEKVAGFVESFLKGDLIPSIILWRSTRSGNIFVIDGAHRLSALIAWIHDDYGDRWLSKEFFGDDIPKEQLQAAEHTRQLLSKIGSYQDIKRAGSLGDKRARPEHKLMANNLGSFTMSQQWVQGDASKAENSFFRINQQAAPIDPTELRIIQAREKPNALAARALIRAGGGHKYWKKFQQDQQDEIERIAKNIYDTLFVPSLETPIKTLDLPVAGQGYSAESVRLLFDFVNLANDARTEALQKQIPTDPTGEMTIQFLKSVRRIAYRISGTDRSSLGLHPAVYFYGATGRRQPTTFLAVVSLIKRLEEKNEFAWFTTLRARFEDFILQRRDYTNQAVRRHGSALKGSGIIFDLYWSILTNMSEGKDDSTITGELLAKFTFLRDVDQEAKTSRGGFSSETKSAAFLRDALDNATRCAICGARLHRNSITVDHIVRRTDGGRGDVDNAQLAHPYCNTGYKEGNIARESRSHING